MQFLAAIANAVRQAVGLILPVFAKAGDFRRWNRWVWRILHLILLCAILFGMWWLNKYFEFKTLLPSAPDAYRPFYLPTLFLLLYGLSWIGYWLWRLLGEEVAVAEFPDVDAAWTSAVRKLDVAGIRLGDAPLFLILGRPAAGDDALFGAAGITCDVRAPGSVDDPLRVFANRDAVYLTCSDASAWGLFARALAGEIEEVATAGEPAQSAGKTVRFIDLGLSDSLVDEMRELLDIRNQRELKPEEAERLRMLAEQTNSPKAAKRRTGLSGDEAARGAKRLEFLGRLIRRDRRPWCPVNGILVLVPWAATESDDVTRNASSILHRDLSAAREAFQLRCPIFALVCDMEMAQGFAEFRRGFPPETLKARVGQRLPLVPDLSNQPAPALYERAVQWIGQTILPAGIMRFLRFDSPADPRKASNSAVHNRNLYSLLREVYTRGPRLARILSRGLAAGADSAPDDQPLFGGCYLAGTGRQAAEQAFVPGVFQRLLEDQSSVAWTSNALRDDARYRRLTVLGYLCLAAVVAAGVLLAVWYARGQKWS
jgi:hypothetical protein